MARQLRIEYPDALYHVISRGNEKRDIYSDDRDRQKFLEYLRESHERFGIKVHAYCLMNNHFHLLLETPRANLSRSMQFLNTSYSVFFNMRNKRVGHLFQGRYRALLVEKDAYLVELSRYIHLNPVRAGLVENPEDYFWSSYRFFRGKDQWPEFLEKNIIRDYFKNPSDYFKFITEGINCGVDDPGKRAVAGCVLGAENFVAGIKEKYLDKEKRAEDLPGLKTLGKSRMEESLIKKTIFKETRISDKEKRKLIIYFLRKFTDKTLHEISGEYFEGQSISGISKLVKRMKTRAQGDSALAKMIKALEVKMSNVKCQMSNVKV